MPLPPAAPLSASGRPVPTLDVESRLFARGHALIGGVDEVGRGAWAGPVSVGIAVVATGCGPPPAGLRDSKALSEKARERLYPAVKAWCAASSVGHAGQEECDLLGMSAALRLALTRALDGLPSALQPSAYVVDGLVNMAGHDARAARAEIAMLPRADSYCASVAAASVIAKVTRDDLMRSLAPRYPHYDLASCKGYPSPAHIRGLEQAGLSDLHRKSWSFASRFGQAAGVQSRLPGVDV